MMLLLLLLANSAN